MVKIKDIMKKYVVTVDDSITVSDAAKILTNNKIGSVIITKSMKPVGIVTTEDIVSVIARGENPRTVKVKTLKLRRLVTANPDDNMLTVARKMIKNGIKRVPVVKDGKLQGIVSDKEILLISPELIEVLSEKLKARVSLVAKPDREISGICERCEAYSDELRNVAGRWLCEGCRE